MKNKAVLFFLGLGLWGCSSMSCCTLADPPVQERATPADKKYEEVRLPVPSTQEALSYLGLSAGAQTWTLSQAQADYLIVEVMSIECSYCQREAKQMNALYELIQANGLGQKIKMVAFGITNSDLEIDVFRKKYEAVYPLVADPDSKTYLLVGRVEIPHIFIISKDKEGRWRKVYAKSRETRKAEDIWKTVSDVTGLSLF